MPQSRGLFHLGLQLGANRREGSFRKPFPKGQVLPGPFVPLVKIGGRGIVQVTGKGFDDLGSGRVGDFHPHNGLYIVFQPFVALHLLFKKRSAHEPGDGFDETLGLLDAWGFPKLLVQGFLPCLAEQFPQQEDAFEVFVPDRRHDSMHLSSI